tara:strand:- start:204 stop:641 length:438 start_codon:yes stop_codon:yes gene_type:complete
MTIQQVDVEIIRSLRSLVLRPGQPIKSTDYDKDKETTTLHYAALKDGTALCIATFYPELIEDISSIRAYRLRGMATHPDYRRHGLASDLMHKAMTDLVGLGCDLLWCKARLVAIEFYESLGFVKIGPMYDIEGIGPHFTMYKKIK